MVRQETQIITTCIDEKDGVFYTELKGKKSLSLSKKAHKALRQHLEAFLDTYESIK